MFELDVKLQILRKCLTELSISVKHGLFVEIYRSQTDMNDFSKLIKLPKMLNKQKQICNGYLIHLQS